MRSLNIYCGDPLARLDEAIADSPAFAQAHLLKAFILALATEPAATQAARQLADGLGGMRLNDREASQSAILRLLLAGSWTAAATGMDFHNMRHPRDLVGLQIGHLMDFERGSARDLRDRLARVMPHWTREVPGHHTVIGSGRERPERTARSGARPSRPAVRRRDNGRPRPRLSRSVLSRAAIVSMTWTFDDRPRDT